MIELGDTGLSFVIPFDPSEADLPAVRAAEGLITSAERACW